MRRPKLMGVSMMSQDEFVDRIDNMVPVEIQKALKEQLEQCDNFVDAINIQEKARVLTIKDKISSTHRWTKATCVDSAGFRTEVFWCEDCNIRCSTFEHINCLSIISQVRDRKPTYTVHNQYLTLTCSEVRNYEVPGSEVQCLDCGIPARGKTPNCQLVNIEE